MTTISSQPVAAASPGDADPLLVVSDLRVEAPGTRGGVTLLEEVAFALDEGRTTGVVGETGSGKTLVALSVLGLLPAGVRRVSGQVRFGGQDLAALGPRGLRSIRGRDIGMVFQDPVGHLDPSFTVGSQLVETLRAHTDLSRRAARQRAADLLDRVGIARPDKRLRDHPHQLSGGMAQRVMIALAISCQPRLLIADEPTTALDATVQAQVLGLLQSLQDEHGMALLLISHDLSVLAEMADDVVVLYGGQVAEQGEVTAVLGHPRHPYTEALLGAQPGSVAPGESLVTIPGSVPAPGTLADGCRFHPRCSHASDPCRTGQPPLVDLRSPDVAGEVLVGARTTRCLRQHELSLRGLAPTVGPVRPSMAAADEGEPERPVLVEAQDLGKDYRVRDGRWPWSHATVPAVDGVSFEIRAGETLGLVGESGAGKSTVGRLVLGIEAPTRGRVLIDGTELHQARGERRRELRRDVQVVFQDPHSSLNPMMTIGAILAEPLEVHTTSTRAEVEGRVAELLELVGLAPAIARQLPDALSGGQRQRVAIARALALRPRLIVCDEPVSALDVSTQAQVVNLLVDLQRELGVAYLFIGHDLAVVRHISDRVAVMRQGRIVEVGTSEQVHRRPGHEYTRALNDAVLSVDPRRRLGRSPGDQITPSDRT
jgi:oligopeptide/dipeptide ABC transporter ATP-binding protein